MSKRATTENVADARDVAALLRTLRTIYTAEGCGIWLYNPHKLLDGKSAVEVLGEADGFERIAQLVEQLVTGAHV